MVEPIFEDNLKAAIVLGYIDLAAGVDINL